MYSNKLGLATLLIMLCMSGSMNAHCFGGWHCSHHSHHRSSCYERPRYSRYCRQPRTRQAAPQHCDDRHEDCYSNQHCQSGCEHGDGYSCDSHHDDCSCQ